MKSQQMFIACAAALAMSAPVFADDAMKAMPAAKTYMLAAQNSSGETGTVSLVPTSDGKGTTVTIALKGAPDAAQPAHVHMGTCAKLDPKPTYPLKSVTDGKSTTELDVPIAKLTGGGFAVNVHKSTNDLATYVACGDLGASSSMMKGDSMMMKPAASASP